MPLVTVVFQVHDVDTGSMLGGAYLRIVDRSPYPGPSVNAGPTPPSGVLYVEVPYHQADLYVTLAGYNLFINGAYAQNMIIAPANDYDTVDIGMKMGAPSSHTLSVFVRDTGNGNAAITGIRTRINMTSPTPGAFKYATTNADGYATYPLLYPGTYLCAVEQDGWDPVTGVVVIAPTEPVETITLLTQRSTITVNVADDGHGSVAYTYRGATNPAPSSFAIASGESVTLQATPSPGYKFSRWETTNITLNAPSNPTATITPTFYTWVTLRATFIPDVATVTLQVGAGGATNPAAGSYTVNGGSTFSFTVTPASGHYLSSITLNGAPQSIAGAHAFVITGSTTIIVSFTTSPPVNRTLTINLRKGKGTVEPFTGSRTYTDTQTITITVTPTNSDATIEKWVLDGVPSPSTEFTFPVTTEGNHVVDIYLTDYGASTDMTPLLIAGGIAVAALLLLGNKK